MVEYVGSSKEAADIVECVGVIISTPHGTMPYMRDMGITSDVVGALTPDAESQLFNEVVDQVEEWEERATVGEVTQLVENEKIIPKVVIVDGE